MAFIDRSEMRDPFFEVKIGPPNAQPKQMITLPTWVHKLIHSFEYSEIRNGGEESASRIKLNFFETLNKPGSVLDLRLDKDNLIFLDPLSVKEGKKNVVDTSVQPSITNSQALESVEKKQSDKKAKQEKNNEKKIAARFLLQERNTIEVIWGYRNSANIFLEARKVRGEILQITHRSAEQDIPATEVIAIDVGSGEHSKIYPVTGINFSRGKVKELLNGKLLDNSNRLDTAPARIDDILRAISGSVLEDTEANVQLTADELKFDIQDAHSSRTWAMGTNLHTFLKSISEKLFAHYFVGFAVKNGKVKTILNVISRSIYEAKYKFHFMWKSGQGNAGIRPDKGNTLVFNTIKDFELQLYPVGGSGGSSAGVDSNNKQANGSTLNYEIGYRPAGSEKPGDVTINKVEKMKTTNGVAPKVTSVGAPSYSPTNSASNHQVNANMLAGRMEANLRLSFTTIGIPQLRPEVILLSNIGERYSGPYYLLSVTHTITADGGYVCNAVGEANTIRGGGVRVPAKPSVADDYKVSIKYKADPGVAPTNVLDTVKTVTSNEE